MPNGNIFISYRRGADSNAAGRLYDRLERHFGAEKLFFDIDSIPLGMDFAEHIDLKVAECDAQLVVIGPGWLENIARLSDANDFVRIEVEAALRRDHVPVVPVLIDGATMPRSEDLPDTLQALLRRNAIEINHAQFAQTVDNRLAEALREHVRQAPEGSGQEAGASPSAADPAPPVQPKAVPESGGASRKPFWIKGLAAVVALAAALFVTDVVWPDWRLTQDGVTGANMVKADHAGGSFLQVGQGRWSEVNLTGGAAFAFREIGRDAWSVYLCDDSRGMGIQLDANRDMISFVMPCSTPFPGADLYTITEAWRNRLPF